MATAPETAALETPPRPGRLEPLADDRLRRPATIEPDHGAEPPPYRMTVDIYDRIVASGALGDTSPIYLWKGQLVLPPNMNKGPIHENALAFLLEWFVKRCPEDWHVRVGSPVQLRNDSVPEPDLVVLKGVRRDFARRTATPADVALAIEVADSSLRVDAGSKLAVYAEAGLPLYWVVNTPRQRIDVYSAPSGPASEPSYADHRSHAPGDEIVVVLDGRELGRLAVNEVLGL